MEKLETFEFGGTRRAEGYDWTTLLDGGIYKLEEKKDFTCKPMTFATLIRNAAKRRGKGVRIQRVEGGIVVQMVPKGSREDSSDQASTAEANGTADKTVEQAGTNAEPAAIAPTVADGGNTPAPQAEPTPAPAKPTPPTPKPAAAVANKGGQKAGAKK